MILLKTDPWVSSQIERVREMEGKEGGVEKERQREREQTPEREGGGGEREGREKMEDRSVYLSLCCVCLSSPTTCSATAGLPNSKWRLSHYSSQALLDSVRTRR